MKTTITGVIKPFKAFFRGIKKAGHIFEKAKQKVKLNIVCFLRPEKARKLKSYYQKLLSGQNKNLIHVGIIIAALSIGAFNILGSNEVTVSAKDSSILVGLLFPEEEQYEVVKSDFSSSESKEKNYLPMVSIASAAFVSGSINNQEVMASESSSGEEEDLNVIGDDTLVKSNPTETNNGVRVRTKAIKHKVLGGETISTVAQRYGIDAATILEENNLYADDIIKPGAELTILPVSGTTERVDSGETLSGIARKHDADLEKIKDYNSLLLASDIEEGQILIIPDGKREVKERPRPETQTNTTLARGTEETRAVAAAPRTTNTSSNTTPTVNRGPSVGNRFPWGYCTWYVASVRGDVTWRGNAGTWLNNARAQGRATGRVPAVGSIMVTSESWWGHVAYVEAVHGDRVTVSEMNYAGYGIKSTRTVSNGSGVIKGYIY